MLKRFCNENPRSLVTVATKPCKSRTCQNAVWITLACTRRTPKPPNAVIDRVTDAFLVSVNLPSTRDVRKLTQICGIYKITTSTGFLREGSSQETEEMALRLTAEKTPCRDVVKTCRNVADKNKCCLIVPIRAILHLRVCVFGLGPWQTLN